MKTTLSSQQQEDLKRIIKKSFVNDYTTAPNGLVAMAIIYLITSIQIKKITERRMNSAMGEWGWGRGVDGRAQEWRLRFVMRLFEEVSEESLRKERSERS